MMTLKRTLLIALASVSLTAAPVAHAYLSPEDILLNKELYLPPTQREGGDRVARQARESTDRREREQEILFEAQRSSEESSAHATAPAAPAEPAITQEGDQLTDSDLRLIRTIRLLDRVDRNQNVLLYGNRVLPMQVDEMHGGAPLAPTGAGGILSAITMVGAVGWTIWRSKRATAHVCDSGG